MTREPTLPSPPPEPPAAGHEWRRFVKIVLCATVLPCLCVIAAAEWLGWSLGETYTAAAMRRAEDRDPNLVWMGSRVQGLARIKLAILAEKQPEVLVMGQSRFGQANAAMFDPYTFYNMSRVAWPLYTYTDLVRHFPPGYRPKFILFNVDFFMFGSKYDEEYKDLAPVYDDTLSENLIETENTVTYLLQYPRLLWQRRDYLNRPALGILTVLSGDGTRADGSEQPGMDAVSPGSRSLDAMMRPLWKRYITGGQTMEPAQMAALKEFVDLGKKMGIPMAAVQMPFFGPTLRSIEADPNYALLKDFRAHVASGYFDQLGIPFFDFETCPPYSEDYRYFFDGVHPGEPLTAMVIEKILADPRIHPVLPRLDLSNLNRRLEKDRTAADHILLPP